MATSWSVSSVRRRLESGTVAHRPPQSVGLGFVLDPPYVRLRAVSPAPGVGSILVTDLVAGISALAAGLTARRPSPWCPLVLLADQVTLTEDEVAAFEPVRGCLGRAVPRSREREILIDSVIAAVRNRTPPTDEILVGYVVERTGCAGVEPALLAAVRGMDDSGRIGRSVTRHLTAFGPLRARDWQGILALARLLASEAAVSPSLERTALEVGIDPRTLRRWKRLVTDLDWRAVAHRPGWEWVLEAGLRKWGYVEE